MKFKRRRWFAIGAGLLIAASLAAWWYRETRLPKFTFEPRPFDLKADQVLRLIVQNDTSNSFRYETSGNGKVRIDCRFQASSVWGEPFYFPAYDDRGFHTDLLVPRFLPPIQDPRGGNNWISWTDNVLAPGQVLQGEVVPQKFFGPFRSLRPFQVGVRLEKPVSSGTRLIKDWFGRWLPASFGQPREIWIWSKPIQP